MAKKKSRKKKLDLTPENKASLNIVLNDINRETWAIEKQNLLLQLKEKEKTLAESKMKTEEIGKKFAEYRLKVQENQLSILGDRISDEMGIDIGKYNIDNITGVVGLKET